MIKYENQCVDCPKEMGCLGNSCRYRNVPVYYCDTCGDEADYEIDGDHYCEQHAKEYVEECWNDLSLDEQAEMLDIDLREVDDLYD